MVSTHPALMAHTKVAKKKRMTNRYEHELHNCGAWSSVLEQHEQITSGKTAKGMAIRVRKTWSFLSKEKLQEIKK